MRLERQLGILDEAYPAVSLLRGRARLGEKEQSLVLEALEKLLLLPTFKQQAQKVVTLAISNDAPTLDSSENRSAELKAELATLNAALSATRSVLRSLVSESRDDTIAIRLPPQGMSLAELADLIKDFQTILSMLSSMVDGAEGARIEFAGVEPGSNWLRVALGSFLLMATVKEAFDISLKVAQQRSNEAVVLAAAKANEEVYQQGKKALQAITDSLVREQAEVFTKKHMRKHTPEDVARMAHVFSTLAGAIQRGVVVEPAKLDGNGASLPSALEGVDRLLKVAPEVQKLLTEK